MSNPNRYHLGTRVRMTATFRDDDDVLTNPTTVVCKTRAPVTKTIATVSNSSASTGIYTAEVTPTEVGIWYYQFTGTGAVVAGEEQAFIVQPSEFD